MSYYFAYGEGDAGECIIYGLGESRKAALRDSVQYGYDYDAQEPYLFTDELSEEAYNYIINVGCNDANDDVFLWSKDGCLEFLGEKPIKVYVDIKNGITRVDDFEGMPEEFELVSEEDFVSSLDSFDDDEIIGAEISNKTYKKLYEKYGIRKQ